MKSYYEILNVDARAGPEEIRRAYRLAVRQAHPDTGGTAEEFHDVQDAWRVLGDPSQRARYDARTATPAGPPPPRPGRSSGGTSTSTTSPPPAAARPPQSHDPAHEFAEPVDPASPRDSASAPGPDPSRWVRPRPLAVLTATLATSSGGLTVLVLDSVGRVFGVIGTVYLLATALAVVQHLRQRSSTTGQSAGPGGGARVYRWLLRCACALAGAFAALALLSWALGESPIAPALWGTCVAAFALSVDMTTRLVMPCAPSEAVP